MIERYDMSLKIKQKPRNLNNPTFAELGLLVHMLANRNSAGNFQEHLNITAERGGSTAPTVHRWQKSLIAKGAVEVVKTSVRGRDGFQTAPVLRPKLIAAVERVFGQTVEQVQANDSQRQNLFHEDAKCDIVERDKPVPNGTLTYNHITDRPICLDIRTDDIPPTRYVGMEQAPASQPPAKYRPGQQGIPQEEFDTKRIPDCPECHLQTCDYWIHEGAVDIEPTCDEECSSAAAMQRAAREMEQEKAI
jgi:hypothetical protein